MRTFLLIAALATVASLSPAQAADTAAATPRLPAITGDLIPDLQTGCLLFSQGDCLAVRVYTASPYTHVAIIVVGDEGPMVYDSMNGTGVRRLTLKDYLAAETPNRLHTFRPARPLTVEQGSDLQEYLENQLGRPYSIRHHLTGRRAKGLHCSEYVTDALIEIGILRAQRPSNVSPASLVTGITRANLYDAPKTIDLEPPAPPQQPAKNRCHKLWLDTKQRTLACCDKLSGWFLCR